MMDMFLAPLPMVYIFRSIFVLRKYVLMLMTTETYFLTAKLLKQGYRTYKIRKAFFKFYHRYSELIVKHNIGLKHFCNREYRSQYFMVIYSNNCQKT